MMIIVYQYMQLFSLIILAASLLSVDSQAVSSSSIFEHSYHADMSDSYLTIERMQYFYE